MMRHIRRQFALPLHVFEVIDAYAQERRLLGERPRPIGNVKFYLLAEVLADGQQKVFAHPVELLTKSNPSGYLLYFGQVRLFNGKERRSHLGETAVKDATNQKRYLLRVESPLYQTVEGVLSHPMFDNTPTAIALLPDVAYPFPNRNGLLFLQGLLQDAAGEPISETTVSLTTQTPAPTGSLGSTYRLGRSGWWLASLGKIQMRSSRPEKTAVRLTFKLPEQGLNREGRPFDLTKVTLSAYYGLPHAGPQPSTVVEPTIATTLSAVTINGTTFTSGDGVEKNGRWQLPILNLNPGDIIDVTFELSTQNRETLIQ